MSRYSALRRASHEYTIRGALRLSSTSTDVLCSVKRLSWCMCSSAAPVVEHVRDEHVSALRQCDGGVQQCGRCRCCHDRCTASLRRTLLLTICRAGAVVLRLIRGGMVWPARLCSVPTRHR